MAQLLIRDLDEETVEYFKYIAKQHHRSLQGEIKSILENVVQAQRGGERSVAITQARVWPKGFLTSILGRWQGETLTREFEGDYETREEFK
ncbi:hypothetical protein BH10PSE19_BH10PSE19_12660 [soil metagenome]